MKVLIVTISMYWHNGAFFRPPLNTQNTPKLPNVKARLGIINIPDYRRPDHPL